MATPEQPQLNVEVKEGSAKQRGQESISGYEPAPTDALPTESVEARPTETFNSGPSIDAAGTALENVAENQIAAQHEVWLTKTHTDYQLQAAKAIDSIKRNAQPGESITPQATDALDKLQETQMQSITSPQLQQQMAQRIGSTNQSLLDSAQQYDFHARDTYVKYNYNQSILGAGDLVKAQSSPAAIQATAMNKLGELLHTADSSPIDPDQRLVMKQDAIKQIGNAAAYASQLKDNHGWLADHAFSLTPEARAAMPDAFSRGIRNNNPGNLEGDDQWQGLTGKDKQGYLQFDTPENGLRALSIDLRNQQDQHGLNTVRDIIGKYAPSSDNNDTSSYIQNVAASLDVKPDDKIDLHDPEVMSKMMDGIIRQENGGNPFGDKTHQWAAAEASNGTTTAPPSSDMAHGGTRSSDPLFNMLPLEDQKALVNESIQVEKQQRYLGAQYSAQAKTQLEMMQANMAKGIVPGDDDLKTVGELVQNSYSPAMQAQFEKVAYRATMTTHANAMSSDALNETINALDAQPSSPSRDDAIAFYQGYLKTREVAVSKDPLGYWHDQGNQLPALDFNKPETIAQREQLANTVAHQYGVSPVDAFMRDDDRQYMTNALQGSTAQQKLQLLNTLHSNLSPGMYNGVIGSLRKDNSVVAAAGDYLGLSRSLDTGGNWFGRDQTISSSSVANALAQGDTLLHPADKTKPFPIPADTELRASLKPEYQQVFRNLPQAEASAFEAAKAYYAYDRMQAGDYSGKLDQKALNDSYQQVLGHTSKFNGTPALAPWGMAEGMFRDRMQEAYTGQATHFGIDTKSFPFGSVSFQNTGQMGKYLAVTGNGYMVNKTGHPIVIDINGANTWDKK